MVHFSITKWYTFGLPYTFGTLSEKIKFFKFFKRQTINREQTVVWRFDIWKIWKKWKTRLVPKRNNPCVSATYNFILPCQGDNRGNKRVWKSKTGGLRHFSVSLVFQRLKHLSSIWTSTRHRHKTGENGRQPRPNGLVVSAGKCAGPIPAENRTSCGKSIRPQV